MKKTILSIFLLMLSVVAFTSLATTDICAYADNEDITKLQVDAVWAVRQGNIAYPNKTDGLDYVVYCSKYATSVTYYFSNDLSETDSGEISLSVNPDNTLQKCGDFHLSKNGEYTFTATITYQEETYESSSDLLIVDDIDMNAPKLVEQVELWGVRGIYYKDCSWYDNTWHYTYVATDSISTNDYTSKHSGIASIVVFYYDITKPLPEDVNTLVENGVPIDNLGVAFKQTYSKMTIKEDFSFAVTQQGVYLLVMTDRAGNCSNVEFLFIHYPDEQLFVTFGGEQIDISDQLTEALDLVENGESEYKSELISVLKAKCVALRTAYDQEKSEDEIKAAYLEFSAAFKAVKNAEALFEVNINNPEMLGGQITLGGFVQANFHGVKKGETVIANITIAEITSASRFPNGVLEVSEIQNPDRMVKITLSVEKAGVSIEPAEPITIKIVWDESVNGSDVVYVVQGGSYKSVEHYGGVQGTRWMTFECPVSYREFYAIITTTAQAERSLTWLWILLGCLGGVTAIMIPVFIFVILPGIKKKAKPQVVENSSGNDNANTEADAKAPDASENSLSEANVKAPDASENSLSEADAKAPCSSEKSLSETDENPSMAIIITKTSKQ